MEGLAVQRLALAMMVRMPVPKVTLVGIVAGGQTQETPDTPENHHRVAGVVGLHHQARRLHTSERFALT